MQRSDFNQTISRHSFQNNENDTQYINFVIINKNTIEVYYKIKCHKPIRKNLKVKRYNKYSIIIENENENENENIEMKLCILINLQNKMWGIQKITHDNNIITLTIDIILLNIYKLKFHDIFTARSILNGTKINLYIFLVFYVICWIFHILLLIFFYHMHYKNNFHNVFS